MNSLFSHFQSLSSMNEASITQSLIRALGKELPGSVIFKHFDVSTDGIPDISVTWGKRTVWLELKWDEGETRPTQLVTMMRLGHVGLAFYVRFGYENTCPLTWVWEPKAAIGRTLPNHDVRAVAHYIREQIRGTYESN